MRNPSKLAVSLGKGFQAFAFLAHMQVDGFHLSREQPLGQRSKTEDQPGRKPGGMADGFGGELPAPADQRDRKKHAETNASVFLDAMEFKNEPMATAVKHFLHPEQGTHFEGVALYPLAVQVIGVPEPVMFRVLQEIAKGVQNPGGVPVHGDAVDEFHILPS